MGARKGDKMQVRKDFNEDQLGAQLCDALWGIQRQRSGCLIGAMRRYLQQISSGQPGTRRSGAAVIAKGVPRASCSLSQGISVCRKPVSLPRDSASHLPGQSLPAS